VAIGGIRRSCVGGGGEMSAADIRNGGAVGAQYSLWRDQSAAAWLALAISLTQPRQASTFSVSG